MKKRTEYMLSIYGGEEVTKWHTVVRSTPVLAEADHGRRIGMGTC